MDELQAKLDEIKKNIEELKKVEDVANKHLAFLDNLDKVKKEII